MLWTNFSKMCLAYFIFTRLNKCYVLVICQHSFSRFWALNLVWLSGNNSLTHLLLLCTDLIFDLSMTGFLMVGIDLEQWLTKAKVIFFWLGLYAEKIYPSFKTAFRELTKLYKEQISFWWKVQSLDNYIKKGIVPHWLRITLAPANRCRNPN